MRITVSGLDEAKRFKEGVEKGDIICVIGNDATLVQRESPILVQPLIMGMEEDTFVTGENGIKIGAAIAIALLGKETTPEQNAAFELRKQKVKKVIQNEVKMEGIRFHFELKPNAVTFVDKNNKPIAYANVVVPAWSSSTSARAQDPSPATTVAKPHSPILPAKVNPGEIVTNSIGMKLTLIPAGEFLMGSNESTADLEKTFGKLPDNFSDDDEHPQHRVKITRPFYFGTYEVSLGEFRRFAEAADYRTDAEKDGNGGWGCDISKKEFSQNRGFTWRSWGVKQSDSSPVVNVSWNDALAFCEWLSKTERKKYRLPTEAEWEYACRAGTTTRFHSGNDPETLARVANTSDGTAKGTFTWWERGIKAKDGYVFTAPAGRFRPNAFGLFDMHGNAAEFCSDWYALSYYANSPVEDPIGPETGVLRVVRGGGYRSYPADFRSAVRAAYKPSDRYDFVGFRVVLER